MANYCSLHSDLQRCMALKPRLVSTLLVPEAAHFTRVATVFQLELISLLLQCG